jgi:transcriptional regulator with XRE-family HTH domain
MGQIAEKLREALLKKQESVTLREMERDSGVSNVLLCNFINGVRQSVSLETAQKLADYLGLELREPPRRR